MNLPFFIARRYLFSKKKHNAINIISGISVCGVALATLALVCTLSVFNGFQDMVAGFFTAFDPELKITVREGKVFDPLESRIRQVRVLPEIDVWTETLEENAMVQYKDRQAMAVIKGVEDNFEQLYTDDAHGLCGSAPVSDVPEFSHGACSSVAAAPLWLFRCGDRQGRIWAGS